MDRIGLQWNWIESRSNLVASANACLVSSGIFAVMNFQMHYILHKASSRA